DYCRENHIRCHKFRVDALKIAKEKNMGIEQAAREARYGVFDALLKKGIVDKIALAHHLSDQAETIILHILRGSGLTGAIGMDYFRGAKGEYIRPFLDLSKQEILSYSYKGILGIIMVFLPQTILDVIAFYVTTHFCLYFSMNLINASITTATIPLKNKCNKLLNLLFVSFIFIFISSYFKSTLGIELIRVFENL
ncbi:MAG: tRNA(Ile)-lysidine synthetase, partial [Erysipelotrichia bacterium]|nr:tRNA(Ile)-lysidine synthetase [Erysipelotrichia bacterium]